MFWRGQCLTAPGGYHRERGKYWPGEASDRFCLMAKRQIRSWMTIIYEGCEAGTGGSIPGSVSGGLSKSPTSWELGIEAGDHSSYIAVSADGRRPAALAPAMKEAAWSFDRNLAISEVVTMDGVAWPTPTRNPFGGTITHHLCGGRAGTATVGIYGCQLFGVAEDAWGRRTDVAGATQADVLLLVFGRGCGWHWLVR
jgi:hypothetical protein